MKIIINTSTLSSTGVTQVAISFITECLKYPENTYHIFMSQTVENELDQDIFSENFLFYSIKHHPLYGIKGFNIRRKLSMLEKAIQPDFVFSIFGPSCWTPKTKHLMGFANSYYVYPDSPFFKIINFKSKIKISILKICHRYLLRRNGDFFVCETIDMSNNLQKFLKIDRSNIFTVSNTYNHFFENPINSAPLLPPKDQNEFRLLSLSSFSIHKNLKIINELIPFIEDKITTSKVKFVMTISDRELRDNFTEDAKKYIINLGRIPVELCPQLYSECDALFAPTLIESFSANYPEAMKMKKPILTSDLSFAHSICDDAAIYFNPVKAEDIVSKIKLLIDDKFTYNDQVIKGLRRLEYFGSPKDRAEKYLEIIKLLFEKDK